MYIDPWNVTGAPIKWAARSGARRRDSQRGSVRFSAAKLADKRVRVRVSVQNVRRRSVVESSCNSISRVEPDLPRFYGTRSARSGGWRRRSTRTRRGSAWRRCSGMWRRKRARRGETVAPGRRRETRVAVHRHRRPRGRSPRACSRHGENDSGDVDLVFATDTIPERNRAGSLVRSASLRERVSPEEDFSAASRGDSSRSGASLPFTNLELPVIALSVVPRDAASWFGNDDQSVEIAQQR